MRSLTAGEARRGEGVKVKLRRNASISYFLGRGGGGVLLLHGEQLGLIQPKHPNRGTISGDTQQRWPPASLHARKLWPIVMRELFVFGPKLSWNSIVHDIILVVNIWAHEKSCLWKHEWPVIQSCTVVQSYRRRWWWQLISPGWLGRCCDTICDLLRDSFSSHGHLKALL